VAGGAKRKQGSTGVFLGKVSTGPDFLKGSGPVNTGHGAGGSGRKGLTRERERNDHTNSQSGV